ncbi:MAG: putative peptidoglycan glycosyltransferase FtsW [Bacteroidota bacterium]
MASATKNLQAPDRYVFLAVLGLAAVGVVAVYSAASYFADQYMSGNATGFMLKHAVRAGIALGAVFIFSRVDYHWLSKWSRIFLIGSLGLMILVQLIGVTQWGATRWLRFGGMGFQPSDFTKIALILYIAQLLAKKQDYIKSFSHSFVPLFLWILGTVALIGISDLSTAALVFVSVVAMCFIGRVNFFHLSGLGAVCVSLALMLLLASPNRAARVEAYLGVKIFPHTSAEQVFNAQDEGYQARQARIAVAMGGLTGVGLGKSTQRDFLPAPYNDFIFAIIAEEYGLLGALLLLGLFLVLLFRGFLRIARHARDPMGLFLAVGITTMVALYGLIHAGVSTGVLPVTGLPMPFVSYGGTSMLATGIMIGILLNISRQIRTA